MDGAMSFDPNAGSNANRTSVGAGVSRSAGVRSQSAVNANEAERIRSQNNSFQKEPAIWLAF